jgi:hypothetical protein
MQQPIVNTTIKGLLYYQVRACATRPSVPSPPLTYAHACAWTLTAKPLRFADGRERTTSPMTWVIRATARATAA